MEEMIPSQQLLMGDWSLRSMQASTNTIRYLTNIIWCLPGEPAGAQAGNGGVGSGAAQKRGCRTLSGGRRLSQDSTGLFSAG